MKHRDSWTNPIVLEASRPAVISAEVSGADGKPFYGVAMLCLTGEHQKVIVAMKEVQSGTVEFLVAEGEYLLGIEYGRKKFVWEKVSAKSEAPAKVKIAIPKD
jgi:hypothetical protein